MEIKDALQYALILKGAIIRDDRWELFCSGSRIYGKGGMLSESADFSRQFMLLLLNTFIEAHKALSKSPEEDKELQNAHDKYEIPFVRTLQKLAKERSHNFVQQWQDRHDNDDKHLIDFGPTNKGTKKRTVKIDPAGETPVDDDPEESEEDVPQIVINIGELNINLNGDV